MTTWDAGTPTPYASRMAVAPVTRPRNISKSVTFDRERFDALEEMARGMGCTFSAAVARLIDLQAGKVLDALEAAASAPVFEVDRWRDRKLTRELASVVAGAVREGATKADAYRSAEVAPKQGDRWEKRGREDIENGRPSLQADLVASIERARAEFNIELLRELRNKGDVKAILKMLDPDQFSEVKRSTVDVSVKFAPLVDWEAMPIEKARLLAELLREYSPSPDDPSVSRTARPAIEAVPPDVLELVEGVDFTEAPSLEAPALGDKKPDH